MTRAFWIGTEADIFAAGQTGFLVEKSNAVRGWTRYELRDRPAQTNQSFQPRLYGWCGTYNDVATTGAGLARVDRVARNGRAYIRILAGAEAEAVLDELGYPELADQLPPHGRYEVVYPSLAQPAGTAIAAVDGDEVKVESHDGDGRRVTVAAIASAVRAHLAGEIPSVVTTADDSLPCVVRRA